MASEVTNVVVAGLGGQGVLTASDILAEAAFRAGRDVKKAEVHGMSQRGGSVSTDVRFGADVLSPMVPEGEADYLVVISPDQEPNNLHRLKTEGGILIGADRVDPDALPNARSINVALLGVLSTHLDIDPDDWRAAIRDVMPEALREINDQAFALGREAGS